MGRFMMRNHVTRLLAAGLALCRHVSRYRDTPGEQWARLQPSSLPSIFLLQTTLLSSPPYPLFISPPRRASVPLRLLCRIPRIDDSPPNNHHIASVFQNYVPRRPILLTHPISLSFPIFVASVEFFSMALGRKRYPRRHAKKLILRFLVQIPLCYESKHEILVLTCCCKARLCVFTSHQIPLTGHFCEK